MEMTYFLKLFVDQYFGLNWSRAQVQLLKVELACFLLPAKVELLEEDIS